jgi:LPXTG-motif cell wall-anchored protein
MKKIVFISLLLFLFPIYIYADNPVIKDTYTADPATLVHDGKVYLYTGHDEATTNDSFFVLKKWNIYSSIDLENWKLEGSLDRRAFDWAKHDSAWASQVVEKNGVFYWYVTVRNNDATEPGYAIGVATSDNPVTGWKDAIGGPLISPSMTEDPEHMGTDPWDDIDPTVYVDDDGEAYMYWGNTHLYYAKLKDNMIEIDGDIKRTEINHLDGSFTEGPWLDKYEGNYYLTFAMNYPEEIGYAMATSPKGPWTFKGKIMNRLSNSATSHPAILHFQEQNYFVYHTASLPNGGEFRRSVSIEDLHYFEDGTIAPITPTASGVSGPSYMLQLIDTNLALKEQTLFLSLEEKEEVNYNYRWYQTPALNQSNHVNVVSFQSENNPGFYLVKEGDYIRLKKNDGTDAFKDAASFRLVPGMSDEKAYSIQPVNDDTVVLAKSENNGVSFQSKEQLTNDTDATFLITALEDIIPEQMEKEAVNQPEVEENQVQEESQVEEVNTKEETDEANNTTYIVIGLVSLLLVVFLSFLFINKKRKK